MSENNPLKALAGWILVTAGVLWTLLCGACTLGALAYVMPDALKHPVANELVMMLATILIPGGIGIAIGLGVLFGGRALLRSPKASQGR